MSSSQERRLKILIVDDSKTIVAVINNILKKDYDTCSAENGLLAIESFKKEKPDLILMDVEMPEMNGFEACKNIKALDTENNGFTPIIFITGKGDLESMKTGLKSGAEDYLAKPFEPEELLARVQAVLRTKKLYNELMDAYAFIQREQDIIASIQQSLLCHQLPDIPGFRFFADYQPSSKASGDYYDFIQIDKDHLGILVADVSGHGSPAAVIMAMMRVVLRSFLSTTRSPKEVLEKINQSLCDNQKSGHFITAFYGVIHLPTRYMKYVSAGHNPPLLIDYESGHVQELNTEKGFPLMIHCDNDLEEKEVELPLNSKLICYTDGLTEARGTDQEMYGMERLRQNAQEMGKSMNAEKLGQALKNNVQTHLNGCEFTDDFTLVVLEVQPTP
ncbi:MAG: SpoIIE family protein phosphatase [Nitrospinaceae bacterium]|nr:SpoIIE family protein phosphatase [Nitrospinaceae bacterium]